MDARTREAVDGFRLAYTRTGDGPTVVMLHGWPGDRHDYDALVDALDGQVDAVVPDLRGFGESDRPDAAAEQYAAAGQAHSVLGLLDELAVAAPLVVGYDVGSRVAQTLARAYPDRVSGLVVAPPLPGAGRRVLDPDNQSEFWYQQFHQLPLVERVLDGRLDAVRAYLEHFWTHWSAPGWTPSDDRLDRLADLYARPGAMTSSITWYRAGSGMVRQSLAETTPDERLATPTIAVWPGHDPLFPLEWSDRLAEFFADIEVRHVDDAGHFAPLEATGDMAAAVRDLLGRSKRARTNARPA